MKKFSFVSLLSIVLFASNAQADTYVNGYFKKDGTYVSGHTRSSSSSKKSGSSHTLDLPANICKDGWESSSRGSGTCSHHGGIARTPLYYTPTQPQRPQTHQPIAHDCNFRHEYRTCKDIQWYKYKKIEYGFGLADNVIEAEIRIHCQP